MDSFTSYLFQIFILFFELINHTIDDNRSNYNICAKQKKNKSLSVVVICQLMRFTNLLVDLLRFIIANVTFFNCLVDLMLFSIAIVNFYNILMDLMRFTTEIVTLQIIGGLIFKA